MTMLAQLSRSTSAAYSSQTTGGVIPKPKGPAQTVGYAVIGLVLLVAIFAVAIKLTRRDD